MLITLVTNPITPLVTQAYAKGNYIWIKTMLRKMNYTSIFISFDIIILIFISPYIYPLWIGNKIEVPRNLSITVGVFAIINVIVNPYSTFLNGIGKIRILVILAPLGVFMFIGGSMYLSYWLKDVIAISISLSLSSLIGLVVIPLSIKKNLKYKNLNHIKY